MTSLELTIESIAAGGDGVGRSNGLVVFVPRTAPGDRARVAAEQHGRLMRGRLESVIAGGPGRVEPPCAHYTVDRCGGCQLQHLSYDAQVEAKAGIIADSLTRIGRLAVERPLVEHSDMPWRYRRKLTLAMRPRGDDWTVGLRRYDAPDEVFDLRDCPITDEQVLRDWADVRRHLRLFPRARELRGAVRELSDGFSFTLEGGRHWPGAQELFAALPRMLELWWVPEGKRRRLVHSRTDRAAAGASFIQVNSGVARHLRDWVLSLAARQQPTTAVDAYSGTGDFAVALASAGTRVTAIEIDVDASRVCASRLPTGSRAVAQAVERALPAALPADLVILNPPRGGVDGSVADILRTGADRVRRIIYVSCNPATLARDIRRMERFAVQTLRGFDMFPQTAHVETVCELAVAA